MLKVKLGLLQIVKIIFFQINKINSWFLQHKRVSRLISVGFGISLVAYFYFILRDETTLIISTINDFNFRYLALCLVLYGFNYYIFFIIWRLLAISFEQKVPLVKSLKTFSITYFSKFIPTPVFFYLSRVKHSKDLGIKTKISITITSLEFICQLFSGFAILAIINIRTDNPITLFWLIGLISPLLLLLYPKQSMLELIFLEKKESIPSNGKLLQLLLLGLIPWILGGVFFSLIVNGSNSSYLSPNLVKLLSIWIISNLASMVGSYLFGGFGLLREFTLLLILEKYFTSSLSLIFAGMVRILLIVSGLFWPALTYLLIKIYENASGKSTKKPI